MSDAPDLTEVESELFGGSPPDLRSRFDAACDAAGVAPLAAAAALMLLVVVAAVAVVVFATRATDAGSVDASLPFTRPAEAVSTSSTSAVPDEIVVHVAGAVAVPGVYRLATDARVVDAVEAAGGVNATADPSRVNLAAPLADGQQVYVVAIGEDAPSLAGGAGPSSPDGAPTLVDINRAPAVELEALPGIGPALGAAIVGHRDEHGPFVALESLLDVSGIGESKLAGLRDFATV